MTKILCVGKTNKVKDYGDIKADRSSTAQLKTYWVGLAIDLCAAYLYHTFY